ncbi:MAG: preprotein translocase subunit SecG [Clostridiaceae bacterium]|nr:preprotein translocase subunit SecG [Clostridiaceae bacterium]
MGVLTTVLAIIDIIVAILLVILVISQEGNSQGMGRSIQGGSDTFFGTGQAKSKEQLQKRLTAILAVLFAILTVVLYLLTR